MNSFVEEMLMHYGMPRRSGRYPWGSGDNPYQHSGDFLSRVEEMKKSGFTFTDKKFYIDISRFYFVLQTKKSSVYFKLLHVRRNSSGL